ncbi:Ferric reductase [Ceratocystis lukuohia]|uniref:Ferric reductase n=1 Tax=Ceratocystis lukuohia TaxID=2019550 RepID=A0ABR4MLQ3_9PEZI
MKGSSRVVAVFVLLAAFAGLCIGLTFVPCYATLCSEDYFPRETRLHLATFYGLLTVTACMLLFRTSGESLRYLSSTHISPELPILGKRITLGGFIVSLWILLITLGTTAFWLPAHLDFWAIRTDPLNWTSAKIQLTVTGVTGHYADIMLGLLIIPISRNSLVGRAFGLHQSTLVYAHKFIAYMFMIASLAHGGAYITYAFDPNNGGTEAKDEAFAYGNPTMTTTEGDAKSFWYTCTSDTGIGTLAFMIVLMLTALSYVRRRFYEVFYYFHIVTSVCIFIGACVHASTDFYLLLPGLLLWVVDWGLRFFAGETNGLHTKLNVTGEDAGNGWYRITLPASMSTSYDGDYVALAEKATVVGSPLAYYYLNIPAISKLQNHAFTAAIPRSTGSGPVFLFQGTQGRSQKALQKQWTWKLGAKLLESREKTSLALGWKAHTVLVILACSLAFWWLNTRSMQPNTQFTCVWTVRNPEMTNVKEWRELEGIAKTTPNLTLTAHVSSESGRLDPAVPIRQCLGFGTGQETAYPPTMEAQKRDGMKAWVYSSGPDGLIRATERACVKTRSEIKGLANGKDGLLAPKLDWYIAKWEV